MERSRKLSRVYLLIASPVILILLIVLCSSLQRAPDPIYAGKPLSEHVIAMFRAPGPFPLAGTSKLAGAQRKQRDTGVEALHWLGPRAVPLLSSWLNDADSLTKRTARSFCARYKFTCPELFRDHSDVALLALSEIPEHASPEIASALEHRLENRTADRKDQCAMLLDQILDHARNEEQKKLAERCLKFIPPLLNDNGEPRSSLFYLLRNALESMRAETQPERERLLDRISSINIVASRDREEIRRLADLVDKDSRLRNLRALKGKGCSEKTRGAAFFRVYPLMAEQVIPLLVPCLLSTNHILQEESAKTLGAYGAEARKALPQLSNLLDHPKPYVVVGFLAVFDGINSYARGNDAREHVPSDVGIR